ncbi:MAG: D-alanine--D-alanine ligase [Bacteroidota bacterium]
MRIGIFFGGPAREREISYSGGKTALENIDKSLFEPVPVFVDCCGNFILLNPENIYKSSIREFYPPQEYQPAGYSVYVESLGKLSDNEWDTLIAKVGKKITPDQFHQYFEFAFLAMHGPGAEDGSIQGLLEWYSIPYSGPGILGSGVGIDKIAQNDMLKLAVGLDKKVATLTKNDWDSKSHISLFEKVKAEVGLPFVVKAPHQGSSIGVAFVKKDELSDFEKAVGQCLFIKEVTAAEWKSLDSEGKQKFIQSIVNLDEGIGFPLSIENEVFFDPIKLYESLENLLSSQETVELVSTNREDAVLFESFVYGQEFSCGVIQTPDCKAVALPPTEIVKVVEVFDFNSKYKPGATRKKLPIDTSLENNIAVQKAVKSAFEKLGFGVCTRIDGFLTEDGTVVLHDPNTIPGMSPTSLIFKQMAEIGLNVTDAITYFIRQSIRERIRTGKTTFKFNKLLTKLDLAIAERKENLKNRNKISVVFGGESLEKLEENYAKARKEFGRLSASTDSLPIPYLLYGGKTYQLPTQLMFKDFAEDLLKLIEAPVHSLIAITRENAKSITNHFVGQVDFEVRELQLLEDENTIKFA